MTLYRNIISQAIKTTWHYKYLWFFGIFAALLGNSGEIEILFSSINNDAGSGFVPGLQGLKQSGVLTKNLFGNIGHSITNDPFGFFLALGMFLLIIILAIFLFWLSIVSQGAIVNNSARVKADRNHDFKKGIDAGMKKFWPLLGMNLTLRIALYGLLYVLSVPIFYGIKNNSIDESIGMIYIVSFLLFIPLGIVLSYIIKYAIGYIMIKEEKFISALTKGWLLFKNNWLVSLEMAFILFFINLLVGLALILSMLVIAVPFIFIIVVLKNLAFNALLYFVLVSAFIFYVLFAGVVGAILSTFQVSSWTGLFVELISKGGTSKLARVFNKE